VQPLVLQAILAVICQFNCFFEDTVVENLRS